MKKNNKKGFTLVELVIVIAVIAILSAILVPTFGNIIANANATKAQSDAKAAVTTHMSAVAGIGGNLPTSTFVYTDKYYMTYTNGNLGPANTDNSKLTDCPDFSETGLVVGTDNKVTTAGWKKLEGSTTVWYYLDVGDVVYVAPTPAA